MNVGWLSVLLVFLLRDVGADLQAPLQCLMGNNSNETLKNTIHLSDVVLAGRIIKVNEGEFGTYSAVLSYYYSYKSDSFLQLRAYGSAKVINFATSPTIGQFGNFFLFREPNMQLSLFCMSLTNPANEDYEKLVRETGLNDTVKNKNFVMPYPNECDSEKPCGGLGSYCSVMNTVPQKKIRCSCLNGFYSDGSSNVTCKSRTPEAEELYCSQCLYNARCSFSPTEDIPDDQDYSKRVCTCDHIHCTGVLQRPVCGSDGNNYSGECQMKIESCKQQKPIHRLYYGNCRSGVVQPCMAIGEPVATSAGFLECSDHSTCPRQYFCHATRYYNVCCPVIETASIATPTNEIQTTNINVADLSNCEKEDTEGTGSGSGADSSEVGDDEVEMSTYQNRNC